jgi:hypothetical protein
VIAAMIVAAVWSGVTLWARAHRRRMGKLAFHRGRFFDLAQRLLADDAADDTRLQQLKQLAADIDSRTIFRRLLLALGNTERDIEAGLPTASPDSRAPEGWAELMFHYYLSVSYLRAVRGIVLRARLTRVLEPGAATRNTGLLERRLHPSRLAPA